MRPGAADNAESLGAWQQGAWRGVLRARSGARRASIAHAVSLGRLIHFSVYGGQRDGGRAR
jgi:hypothetical protein